MLTGGLLCSDATLNDDAGRWFVKGDPTEGALVVLAAKASLEQFATRTSAPRIAEIPFSSERKRMTTVHRMPDGRHLAFVKGAPEVLLDRCVSTEGQGHPQPLTDASRAQVLAASETMAKDALRVLAIAYREVGADGLEEEETVERDLTFLGLIGMMDPPRDEAKDAVRVCREVHIRPIMITGDHMFTAVAVATEVGIYREGDMTLTGDDLGRMGDAQFEQIVDKVTVYARVSPMDKLKIVKAWKKRGEIVAMTGDGVNDAPALKHADIGIAMGISGTDVAKEAADMVLGDDNFATIVKAIERGRWIYDNIKKYLTYLLRANITEVVVLGGVVIVVGPELLPLLPAAILYINLATDGLPALALGLSPPDRDIMQRPPRNPSESIFSRDVRLLVLLGRSRRVPDLPVDILRQLHRHRGREDQDLPALRLRRADHFDVLPVASIQPVRGAAAQMAHARDGVGDRVARRADSVRDRARDVRHQNAHVVRPRDGVGHQRVRGGCDRSDQGLPAGNLGRMRFRDAPRRPPLKPEHHKSRERTP